MLEFLVAIGLTILLMPKLDGGSSNGSSTNDEKERTRRRLNSMTMYEIDKELKERDLYGMYGEYSRTAKVERLSDRFGNR